MRLLATCTIEYVDDDGRPWRFTLSAMNVIARSMYEQLYLSAARDWYIAAIGKKPEDVIQEHTARAKAGEEHTRRQQYEYALTDSVYGWAMIYGSLVRVELSAAEGEPFVEIETPDEWKTPSGMMESMKRDLFTELSVQGYKLNRDVLFDPEDEVEKKRGVIRVS